MKAVHLLVTAVGSELAFAVIKACRLIGHPLRLLGCDMTPDVVGRHWCDGFHTVPAARAPEAYLHTLTQLVESQRVEAIIPTADAEFELLAAQRELFLQHLGCHILVNPLEELRRFNDKWTAHQWYQEHGIPAPATFRGDLEEDVERAVRQLGFPMMLKPRVGGGSRHILRLGSPEELRIHLPIVPAPLLQECVLPDDEEYTAGTYRAADGRIHVIILQRSLKFGMTNRARSLTGRPELEEFCRDVISRTRLEGSNNIQFRIGPRGPQVLEINPRFSGTTGIRANCGFNDVEMWLADALGHWPAPALRIRQRQVLRYMEELYIDP